MNYYQVIPITKTPVNQLTYQFEKQLRPGTFVKVPFGKKDAVAVVIQKVKKPDFLTKLIDKILDEIIWPEYLLQNASWMAGYYNSALSNVLQTCIPAGVGKSRRKLDLSTDQGINRQRSSLPLTSLQKKTVESIEKSKSTVWIHGDTGTGKTRIYVELIDKAIQDKKDSLVLVPEISLTPQLVNQFRQLSAAENVFVIHSGLSESKRHQLWKKISEASPAVVIGTRSCLFSPLKNLGLIVVDEAHDSSYQQDKHPKYDSLRVAGNLSNLTGAQLILGSATPPIEEIYLATQKSLEIISLKNKIHEDKRDIHLVNLSDKTQFKRHRYLSDQLLRSIEGSLAQGQQSLLLLNRRGTRQSISCQNCGWFAQCGNCLIPLKYHHDNHTYRCHLCGVSQKASSSCPSCKEPAIKMSGLGTKQLVIELKKLFPAANIFRYDQETVKAFKSHPEIYKQINSMNVDIIVGTQLISKGFDLARLKTVAAVNADSGFQLPDFSSSQRTFQMIYQLAGRGGRRGQVSEVFIQTFLPDNHSINSAYEQDYKKFYLHELKSRKSAVLPPFVFMLKLECKFKSQARTIEKARALKDMLTRDYKNISVFGPTPSFHEFNHGLFHWQIVIKSKNRQSLQKIVEKLPSGWDFQLDPVTLL